MKNFSNPFRRVRKASFRLARKIFNKFGLDLRRTWFRSLELPAGFESELLPPRMNDSPSRGTALAYLSVGLQGRELLENSVLSARKAGYKGEIWVYSDSLSPDYRTRLETIGASNFEVLPNINGVQPSTAFGDPMFRQITHLKWQVIRSTILKSNKTVIFADSDVVFLEDPEKYVVDASSHFAVGVQSESRSFFPPSFCIGLMYFTQESLPLLQFLMTKSMENVSQGTAQQVFNELILSNPSLLQHIWVLPESVFPVGLSYPLLQGEQHEEAVHQGEVIAFHANWFPSNEAKIRALDSIGLWNPPSL